MNILFFAQLRESVGLNSCSISFVDLDLSGSQSVIGVVEALYRHENHAALRHADLSCLRVIQAPCKNKKQVLASVDQELVEDFTTRCITDGSELAFFPPVTGG